MTNNLVCAVYFTFRLLQKFSFEQNSTRVGQLVDFVTTMFTASQSRSSINNERAQLLVIVSDGRVMSEGPDKVKQAVRRAKQNGIFMVFVIVDNPESKVILINVAVMILIGIPDTSIRCMEMNLHMLLQSFRCLKTV